MLLTVEHRQFYRCTFDLGSPLVQSKVSFIEGCGMLSIHLNKGMFELPKVVKPEMAKRR